MTIKKYKGDEYTVYVNGNSVVMAANLNGYQHSLSNLYISTDDVPFYKENHKQGWEKQEESFKKLFVEGDIDRINKITKQNFKEIR